MYKSARIVEKLHKIGGKKLTAWQSTSVLQFGFNKPRQKSKIDQVSGGQAVEEESVKLELHW